MKLKIKTFLWSGALALTGFTSTAPAQVISVTDNWNDGNDTANPVWTRYRYTGIFGVGNLNNTFTFPINPADGTRAYRLTSDTGSEVNPGRVGSFLMGSPVIPDFVVAVDLIDWAANKHQAMGVMARVQSPIPNTTTIALPTGYVLGFVNQFTATGSGTDSLGIMRIGGTSATTLTSGQGKFGVISGGSEAPLPTGDYRLVFAGQGSLLWGHIIDKSTDQFMTFSDGFGGLTNRLVAVDTTLTTGRYGLIATVGGAGAPNPGVDVTFDNFHATVVPEPSVVALLGVGLSGLIAVRRAGRQCR